MSCHQIGSSFYNELLTPQQSSGSLHPGTWWPQKIPLKLHPSFRDLWRRWHCSLPSPSAQSHFHCLLSTGVDPNNAHLHPVSSPRQPHLQQDKWQEGKEEASWLSKAYLSAGCLFNLIPLLLTTLTSPFYRWGQKDAVNCPKLYNEPSLLLTRHTDKWRSCSPNFGQLGLAWTSYNKYNLAKIRWCFQCNSADIHWAFTSMLWNSTN